MQISANGTRVLHALGLEAEVARLSFVPAAEGNPALEHGPDLEAVRPRRGLGRALRLSLRDDASARPARDPGRRDRARETGRASPWHAVRRAHAIRFRRADRVRQRRRHGGHARGRGRRRAFDRARMPVRGADAAPQFTGLVAWRGLVPIERLPPQVSRTRGHQLGRPGRPRGALSGAARRIDELRGILPSATIGASSRGPSRERRRSAPATSATGTPISTRSSGKSRRPTNGP